MIAKFSPLEDNWRIFDIPVSGNKSAHIAGVYRVYSGTYYCSLILDPVYKVPEFMAFQWNAHANKVTNWMDVYCQRRDFAPNLTCSDVDVATFRSCIKDFFNFLAEKEEKENDD